MRPDHAKETTPGVRLVQALELMAFGFAMQRQSLRRRNPSWTDHEVERAFLAWLVERPPDPLETPD